MTRETQKGSPEGRLHKAAVSGQPVFGKKLRVFLEEQFGVNVEKYEEVTRQVIISGKPTIADFEPAG